MFRPIPPLAGWVGSDLRGLSFEGGHGWAHCMMSNARAPRGPAS